MNSSSRFGLQIFICLLGAALGAGLGYMWRVNRIPFAKREFVSQAKLTATPAASPALTPASVGYQDYYDAVADSLESEALASRASQRLNKAQPDLIHSPVKISVDRQPPRESIAITATGSDIKFTPKFLDALVDEFVASRAQQGGGSLEDKHKAVEKELAAHEKTAKEKLEALTEAKKQAGGALLKAEQDRQAERATQLRSERDVMDAQLKTLGAGTPERVLADKKLQLIEADLGTAEKAVKEAVNLQTKIEALESEYQASLKAYEETSEKAQSPNQKNASTAEEITIQYHATQPRDDNKDKAGILDKTVLTSSGIGLVVGIFIAMLVGGGGGREVGRRRY